MSASTRMWRVDVGSAAENQEAFLRSVLACPNCLDGRLTLAETAGEEHLECAGCGSAYAVRFGVPQLIDPRAMLAMPDELLAAWHVTQREAVGEYRSHDPASCSLISREDVQRLRGLMELKGKRVLDIGSGVFQMPGYAAEMGAGHYVGVDPIPPERRPEFSLITACSELLPFRDDSFDVVLLASSLDHVVVIGDVLREIFRVLSPGGMVLFWGGLHREDRSTLDLKYGGFSLQRPFAPPPGAARGPAALHAAELQLAARVGELETRGDIRDLLADRYHLRHLTRDNLLASMDRAGMQLLHEEAIVTTAGVASDFLRFGRRKVADPTSTHLAAAVARAESVAVQQRLIAEDQRRIADGHTALLEQLAVVGQAVNQCRQGQWETQQMAGKAAARSRSRHRRLAAEVTALRAELAAVRGLVAQLHAAYVDETVKSEPGLGARTLRRIAKDAAALREQVAALEQRLEEQGKRPFRWAWRQAKRAGGALRRRAAALWYRLKAPYRHVRSWQQRATERSRRLLRAAPALGGAYFARRRKAAPAGKRVLMLTISQIDIDPRINKVARAMVRQGHEVEILCYRSCEDREARKQAYPGVAYQRIPRDLARPSFSHFYQPEFVADARIRTFDYVHVNDLTTLLTGWAIARRAKVPLIYDAHEMWSENVTWRNGAYGAMPWKKRFAARLLEGFLLRYVDVFMTVSPSICAEYQRRHGLKEPPMLLANYPELALLQQVEPGTPTVRELCGLTDEHFVTIYLGGVNTARNIETVVAAHAYLPPNYVFILRGPGGDYFGPQYLKQAEELGLAGRVFVLPAVDKDRLLEGPLGADCGVVMLRNLCKNFYWFYPNKFFEYMLAGLPVAVSNFPDVAAHVERERCGVTFDPDSPQSIAAAIRRLGDDRAEARAMGARGREGVQREYNWEAAIERLLAAYARLAGEGKRR